MYRSEGIEARNATEGSQDNTRGDTHSSPSSDTRGRTNLRGASSTTYVHDAAHVSSSAWYYNRNCYTNHGGNNMDSDGQEKTSGSMEACSQYCDSSSGCACATYEPSSTKCWRLYSCSVDQCDQNSNYRVYTRSSSSSPSPIHGHWTEGKPECVVPSQQALQARPWLLRNVKYGKYLEDPVSWHTDDVLLSWAWSEYTRSALWKLEKTPNGFYIVNSNSMSYLDSYTNEGDVRTWVGNGLSDQGQLPANHRWHFEHATSCTFYIKHDASKRYLTTDWSRKRHLAKLQQGPDDQWELIPVLH